MTGVFCQTQIVRRRARNAFGLRSRLLMAFDAGGYSHIKSTVFPQVTTCVGMRVSSLSKPIRTVMAWQVMATMVAALITGWFAGMHGAISAALGGAISILAGLVSVWLAARSGTGSPGEALYGALRAEVIRIILMLSLLWLVLANYKNVVALGLIGTFIVSVLLFTMAIFVRVR